MCQGFELDESTEFGGPAAHGPLTFLMRETWGSYQRKKSRYDQLLRLMNGLS